jgi:hypothetical protein
MLELLLFLRADDVKTFVVSGGGIDFMRPWTERVYGIPPYQVVGSAVRLKCELRDGEPILMRLPEGIFVNDKQVKPEGIGRHIGLRPIAAFGNSDGDYEMLRWTTAGPGPRFGLIVHHPDPVREYACDDPSLVGQLHRALEAPQRSWIVVSLKNDWRTIFPAESPSRRDDKSREF